MRLQSAVVCGHCERRIEGEQHHRHTNVITPSISPYERMASLERDELRSLREDGFAGTNVSPTKRWLRRNGTSRVPYEMMVSPVRRSRPTKGWLRWNGTSRVPYGKTVSPVRTSRPTKRWLRRNGTSRVPYEMTVSPVRRSRPTKRWLRRYKRLNEFATWSSTGLNQLSRFLPSVDTKDPLSCQQKAACISKFMVSFPSSDVVPFIRKQNY